MNRVLVDKLATALLYEGYVLYPYRPSVKNKQRWTFGGIYPQAWSEAQNGAEPWMMQTECLVEGAEARIRVIVRFLQLIERTVGRWEGKDFQIVAALDVGEKRYQPWQEAMEREIDLGEFRISDLRSAVTKSISFGAEHRKEILHDIDGKIAGAIFRRQENITVAIEMIASPMLPSSEPSAEVPSQGEKISIRIRNVTPLPDAKNLSRDQALLSAMVSTHTILGIEEGQFISLTDPPAALKSQAAACRNIGAWPVLVGEEPARDTILSSPIILSDYPEIAPESPGDLFDGLEIDEILTLRIMTLTDEEKKTAAAMDERVDQLLKRTESLARQQMMNLHGAIRGMKIVEEPKNG